MLPFRSRNPPWGPKPAFPNDALLSPRPRPTPTPWLEAWSGAGEGEGRGGGSRSEQELLVEVRLIFLATRGLVVLAMEEEEGEVGEATPEEEAAAAEGTVTSGGTRLRFDTGLVVREMETTSLWPLRCRASAMAEAAVKEEERGAGCGAWESSERRGGSRLRGGACCWASAGRYRRGSERLCELMPKLMPDKEPAEYFLVRGVGSRPPLLRPEEEDEEPSGTRWWRPSRGLEGTLAAPLPPPTATGGSPSAAEDDEEPFHMDSREPVLAERRPSEDGDSRLSCDWLREIGRE